MAEGGLAALLMSDDEDVGCRMLHAMLNHVQAGRPDLCTWFMHRKTNRWPLHLHQQCRRHRSWRPQQWLARIPMALWLLMALGQPLHHAHTRKVCSRRSTACALLTALSLIPLTSPGFSVGHPVSAAVPGNSAPHYQHAGPRQMQHVPPTQQATQSPAQPSLAQPGMAARPQGELPGCLYGHSTATWAVLRTQETRDAAGSGSSGQLTFSNLNTYVNWADSQFERSGDLKRRHDLRNLMKLLKVRRKHRWAMVTLAPDVGRYSHSQLLVCLCAMLCQL